MTGKAFLKKEYIILVAIIVILLGLWLFQNKSKLHYKIPVLDPVKKEDIDKLEIKQTDRTITLVKKDSGWVIDPQGYPTDVEKLENILKTISQLSLTDLASQVKNYSLYDLDKDKAVQVKAYRKDNLLREFEVGKIAPTFGHTFVKIKDNPNVYYAREAFRNHFEVKIKNLRNKEVMKLDSNEITALEIEKEGNKYVFTKNAVPVQA